MTRTRKALILVLSILCVVCLGMFTLSACKKKAVVSLSKIQITQAPDKVLYIDGEEFKPDGMKVTATFSDETTKELDSSEWTFTAPDMHVTEGSFSAVKTVKVSYTFGEGENEVTKTANQTITVTNKIKSATVTVWPKQDYSIGQKFNVSGMKIHAVLENGSETDIEITAENASISVEGTLGKTNKEVVVTIGGYSITVPITLSQEIYLEAEYGYINGEAVDFNAGDYGHVRTDASEEAAKAGAQAMFEAQLKADFALANVKASGFDESKLSQPSTLVTLTSVCGERVTLQYDKIVEWLADKSNEAAIKAYVEGEEYKKAVEDYLASEQFEEDWKRYVAHDGGDGENYLGQLNQGDTVSFVFESSAAGNSNIAFRIASSYLYIDNGGWVPKVIGDVQFNKVFEIYVNGVKMEIDDEKLLEGGMTADGSANQILWTNWDNVEFENVSLVKGRNVIEIKILEHGYKSPAQPSYDFAANIDTLYIEPVKDVDGNYVLELDMYENFDVDLTTTVTKAELAAENGRAVLTITGTVEGSEGYLVDRINLTVAGLRAEVVQDGNAFTATLDVTDLDYDSFEILSGGETLINVAVEGEKFTLTPESSGYVTSFELAVEENTKTLLIIVDSANKVVVEETDVSKAEIDLVTEGKHVYVEITGSFKATYGAAYDLDDEESVAALAEILGEKIQEMYFLNIQQCGDSWKTPLGENFHSVTVDVENNKFTVLADVTGWAVAANTANIKDGEKGIIHFALKELDNGKDGWNDYKPDVDTFVKTQTVGSKTYTLTYDKNNCFGLIYIYVTEVIDENTPAYENTDVTLKQDGEDIQLVINGTYKNYEKAEMEEELNNIVASIINHKDLNPDSEAIEKFDLLDKHYAISVSEPVTAPEGEEGEGVPAKSGTYTITISLTDVLDELKNNTGVFVFYLDFDRGETAFKAEIAEDAVTEIKTEDVRYTLFITTSADTSNGSLQGLVAVRAADVGDPVFEYTSWEVKAADEKVYAVINFTVENMTEEEATAMVAGFDFEAGNIKDQDGEALKIYYAASDLTFEFDSQNNAMTVSADITNLQPDYYWAHLFLNEEEDSEPRSIDFGAEVDISVGDKAVLGRYEFEIKAREFDWGGPVIRYLLTVTDTKISTLEIAKTEFKEVTKTVEGGDVPFAVMVITGSITNYDWNFSEDNLPEFVIETVHDGGYDESWNYDTVSRTDKLTVEFDDSDPSKFVAVWELSSLTTGHRYWIHFGFADSLGDLPSTEAETVRYESNGLRYVLEPADAAADSPTIAVADLSSRFMQIKTVGLETDGNAVYLVYSGECNLYTKEELESYALDLENGTRRLLNITATLNEASGEFTLKADISDKETFPADGFYYMHGAYLNDGQTLESLGESANVWESSFAVAEGKDTVTANGFTYTLNSQYGIRGVTISS